MLHMSISVSFGEGTKLVNYYPVAGHSLCFEESLSFGKRISLANLPAPILKAFLDYYGDPNNVGSDPAPGSGVSNPDRDGDVCDRSDLVTVDVS